MKIQIRLFPAMLAFCCVLALVIQPDAARANESATQVDFGVLPVMQALPLFVAEEQGFFSKRGLTVRLVPFQSAAEKDIALKAGAIDGYFGDLFTPLVIEGNGLDISIVATNYSTGSDARMFGILASEKSGIRDIKELAGNDVGISTASVIDYVTQELLIESGVDVDDVELLDMKNIGLRMQMLMSGQLDAATLPEPLLTAAQKGGATLLADDTGMQVSQTVLIFSEEFLSGKQQDIANTETVSQFLAAVDEANAWIAENPRDAREIMIARTRVPEPLQQVIPLPVFPTEMAVPAQSTVEEAINWLKAAGVLKNDLTYTGLVNGAYLP